MNHNSSSVNALTQCPLHPRGGCGFASHGTCARKTPAGTRIARWYCREGHCTVSQLPDHLAARVPVRLRDPQPIDLNRTRFYLREKSPCSSSFTYVDMYD